MILKDNDQIYLTDGGMETSLIFQEGFDLPYFAAFDLLKHRQGREAIKKYYEKYAALAIRSRTGFILESPTWRANSDWGAKIGYNKEQLANANRDSIDLLQDIRNEFSVPESPILISGCIGPRGDGYHPGDCMTAEKAALYHYDQVKTFSESGVDMVSALTMTYVDEAIGIVRAAQSVNLPVVISFTTETDGNLPDGTSMKEAIELVDKETANGPEYYMINCAHPDHFSNALENEASWVKRIQGVRANASRKSHAELDESEILDSGNPEEFGQLYQALRSQFPQFRILGGCCGTDHRHVGHICTYCIN